MSDEVIKYIESHYPLLFVIGIIIVGIIWITWRAFMIYGRLQKVETHCEKIPEITNESLTVKDQLSKISNSIEKIFVFLNQQHTNFPTALFVSRSPIQLTDLGEEILMKSGGKDYVDKNSSELLSSMKRQNFESALDLQNYAQTLLLEHSQRGHFNQIKNFIFNNPRFGKSETEQIDTTLPLVINLMAIYLRNQYFDLYPELTNNDNFK